MNPCPKCGTLSDQGATACTKCGLVFQPDPGPGLTEQAPSSGLKWTRRVLLSIFVFAVLVWVAKLATGGLADTLDVTRPTPLSIIGWVCLVLHRLLRPYVPELRSGSSNPSKSE